MSVGIRCARSFIQVLGIQTAFYRKGRGKTLVLMHGASPGACSDLNWYRNFDALVAQGYEVIAYDQPGFGHSETPEDHSLEFRVAHAQAFLQALGITSAVLVGNSMGGLISVLVDHRKHGTGVEIEGLVLLAQFPHFEMNERARALAEEHRKRLGVVEPEVESVRQLTRKTFFNSALATEEIVQLRAAMLAKNWVGDQARKAANKGLSVSLDAVRSAPVLTPSLIIWGRNDESLSMEIGIQALEHFPEAQLLLLPRCGHWPQSEHPTSVNSAILAFLEGLGNRQSPKDRKSALSPQRPVAAR